MKGFVTLTAVGCSGASVRGCGHGVSQAFRSKREVLLGRLGRVGTCCLRRKRARETHDGGKAQGRCQVTNSEGREIPALPTQTQMLPVFLSGKVNSGYFP